MRERCSLAQGACAVGFALSLFMLAMTISRGLRGASPLLTCVDDGCLWLIWTALLFIGARFFGCARWEGGPFRAGRAGELKAISVLTVLSSFVPGLVTWLLGKVLLAASMDPSLTQEAIEFGQIVNIPVLYAGFVISAFALIISYGCVLQQQDDGLV